MAKLSPEQRSLMRLILRSPDLGDGWRAVSAPLWRHFPLAHLPGELVEMEDAPEGRGRVRLTERGAAVMEYT